MKKLKEKANVKKAFKRHVVYLRAFFIYKRDIPRIFLACDLRPVDNWKKWKSPHGSIISITDNGIRVYSNNKLENIRDLYQFANIKNLINNGKQIGFIDNYLLILGEDDKLRMFDLDLNRVCPFGLGIKLLREFYSFEKFEIQGKEKLKQKIKWVCKLPMNESEKDTWLKLNKIPTFLRGQLNM